MSAGPAISPTLTHRSSQDPSLTFQKYFQDERVEGTSGASAEDKKDAYYLPEDALQRWFTEENICHSYRQIYWYRDHSVQMYDPAQVRLRYRRVFAILLYIGRADLLDSLWTNEAFDDGHLPFYARDRFPGSAADFDSFFEAQWKFCVPPMEYRHRGDWDPRCILPFKISHKLGEGSAGKAYLINVHPAHNKLRPEPAAGRSGWSSTKVVVPSDQMMPNENDVFVLKVFRTKRTAREQWLAEATNHVAVRTDELTVDGGIIGFYGCFSHGSTFGILLEHAPFGSLEQLFQRNNTPQSMEDILDLWISFFSLLSTLSCLRRMEKVDRSCLQLCHFDIKPSNVLVLPGQSGRAFDFKFKLGDLGSSVHCPLLVKGEVEAAYTLQKPGTRTYGAPECCQVDPNSDELLPLNYVDPRADMWSFGCIGSELATWVVRGRGGLQAYREARKDNHDQSWADGDCFHLGHSTLPYIQTHHDRLGDDMSMNPSNATVAALTLVQRDMLQFEPERRKHPRVLMHEAKDMMIQVKKNIKALKPNGASKHELDRSVAAQISSGPAIDSLPAAPTAQMPCRSLSIQPNTLNMTLARKDGFYTRAHHTSERRATTDYHDVDYRGKHQLRTQLDERFEGATPVSAPPVDTDDSRPNIVRNNPGSRTLPVLGQIVNDDPTHPNVRPSALYQTRTLPQIQHITGGPLMTGAHGLPMLEDPASYMAESPEQLDHEYIVDNITMADVPSETVAFPTQATPRTSQCVSDRTIPTMSISDAIAWRESAKHSSNRGLPKLWRRSSTGENPHWRHLSQEFEDRDFIILVDDSSAMRKHWDNVEQCASLLAFCTTPYDKNGIDLRFMISGTKHNSNDYNSITRKVGRAQPPIVDSKFAQIANINNVLGGVLEKYQEKVEGRRRRSIISSAPRLKKLILFVLTDGLWGPHSDAEEPIKNLVERIRLCGLPGNQIGVQFIKFGDDPDGAERLQKLDDFLHPDVIDVEPYPDGNFFKMLLGSINKDFDYSNSPDQGLSRVDSPIRPESSSTPTPTPISRNCVPSSSLVNHAYPRSNGESAVRGNMTEAGASESRSKKRLAS